jgi:hypothetical protein
MEKLKTKNSTKTGDKKFSSMTSIQTDNSSESNFIISKVSLDESKKTRSIGLLKNAKEKIDNLNSLFTYKNFFLEEKKSKQLKSVTIKKIKNSEEEIGFSNNINLNVGNFKKILGTQQDYESYDLNKKPNILNYHKEDAELMVNLLDSIRIKKMVKSYNNFGIKSLLLCNENERKNKEFLTQFANLLLKNNNIEDNKSLSKKNTFNLTKNQTKVSFLDRKPPQDTNNFSKNNYYNFTNNTEPVPKLNYSKKFMKKSRQNLSDHKDETFLANHLSTSKQTTREDVIKTESTASRSKTDLYLKTYSESLKSKSDRLDQIKWITSYTNYKKTNFKEMDGLKFSPSKQSLNFNLKNLNLIRNPLNISKETQTTFTQKFDTINAKETRSSNFANNANCNTNFMTTTYSDNEKMTIFNNKKKNGSVKSRNFDENNPNINVKNTQKFFHDFYNVLNLEEIRAKLILKNNKRNIL